MPTKPSRKPTSAQVHAWLATVLNPLRSGLGIAERLATSGQWSFRADTQDQAIGDLISKPYELNLRQYEAARPQVHRKLRAYDARLEALLNACREAFHWIEQQASLRSVASAAEKSVAAYGGADRLVALLAQYAVNQTGALSAEYATADIWNRERAKILALFENDPVGSAKWRALHVAGAAFRGSAVAARAAIEADVFSFADEHGLSAVDPSARVL